jgi:hypothetical protein
MRTAAEVRNVVELFRENYERYTAAQRSSQ